MTSDSAPGSGGISCCRSAFGPAGAQESRCRPSGRKAVAPRINTWLPNWLLVLHRIERDGNQPTERDRSAATDPADDREQPSIQCLHLHRHPDLEQEERDEQGHDEGEKVGRQGIHGLSPF